MARQPLISARKLIFSFFASLAMSLALPSPNAQAGSLSEAWYLMRARSNAKIGNYKAAVEAYEHAVAANPKNMDAVKELGLAYQHQGQSDKAIATFDQYLKVNTDDLEVLRAQGEMLSWQRYAYRAEDAIKFLRAALKIQEDDETLRKFAEVLARDKKHVDEAISVHQRLLERHPNDQKVGARYRQLVCWTPATRDLAIQVFEKYLNEQPDDREAQYQLARLYAAEPDHIDSALKQYDLVAPTEEHRRSFKIEYARVLARSHSRDQDAKREYERALSSQEQWELRLEFADFLARRNEWRDEAIQNYRQLLRQRPKDSKTRLKLARVLLRNQRDAEAAAKEFDEVLTAEPNNILAHEGAADAQAWVGNRDLALYHAEKAKELRRQNPAAAKQADFDKKSGLLDEKINEFKKGRQPMVGIRTDAGAFWGSRSRSIRAALGPEFRSDVTPFASVQVFGGAETLREPDRQITGARLDLQLEVRPIQKLRLDFERDYHGAAASDSNVDIEVSGNWQSSESASIEGGFQRTVITDSIRSFAGDSVDGVSTGGAMWSRAYGRYARIGILGVDEARIEIGNLAAQSGEVISRNRLSGSYGTEVWELHSAVFGLRLRGEILKHSNDDRKAVNAAGNDISRGTYTPYEAVAIAGLGVLRSVPAKVDEDLGTLGENLFDFEVGPSLNYIHGEIEGNRLVVGVQGGLTLTVPFGRMSKWEATLGGSYLPLSGSTASAMFEYMWEF